jgi:hypothetical protein
MPATPLPSSGANPLDGPTTCDASGMVEIHRLFRHSFDEAPGLVDAVAEGDTAHADVVAAQLGMISTALHGHHEGEDARLWPVLDERAPSCAAHVERMRQQHAAMLVQLNALDAALPAWRAQPSAATAQPVQAALGGIRSALTAHLPDEEANIVPLMEHTLTEQEVEWFAKHGRASTPKGQMWNMLGAILDAQPDGGDAWLKKNMPGPMVLAWRWAGSRRYARYRSALEGRAVP